MIVVMSNIAEDFLTTTGQRVRFARAEMRGLQNKELAAKADISPGMLSKIERDQKNPSLEVLTALAKALDVSIDWLMPSQRAESPYRRVEDEPVYFSPEADKVARIIDDFPPKYREIMLEQALALKMKFALENREYRALVALVKEVAGPDVGRQIEQRLLSPADVPEGTGTTTRIVRDQRRGDVPEPI